MKLLLLASTFLLSLSYLNAAQDSDGNEFITSFPWYNEPNPDDIAITLNFVNNVPKKNRVTISYWSVKQNIQISTNFILDPNAVMSYNLFFRDVVKDGLDLSKEATLIPDPRIIINSHYSMKVISRIYNQKTGLGDAEMIPQSDMAHSAYLVRLPAANPGGTQIIHILASNAKDALVTVYHTIDGEISNKYDLKVTSAVGSYQNVITNPSDPKRAHSFSIYSNKQIIVVGAVSRVNLIATGTNGVATIDSPTDYSYMHFYNSHFFDCTYAFFKGSEDHRMITSEFTKSVYVTPPRTNGCINYLPILVYSQLKPNDPTPINLKIFASSSLNLTPGSQGGTSSEYSYTPWIRFGGFRAPAPQTQLLSSFLHYVPETSQFIHGSVFFFTFTPNSYIEIYAKSIVDTTSFFLDGVVVDGTQFQSQSNIPYFKAKYNVFTILVKNAGSHIFEVKQDNAKYIAYVTGYNVKGAGGSYGYVAGYNTNSLEVYTTNSGTDVPPVTTTKSGSKIEKSLFMILFAFVFVKLL
uniref:IgGFc_binding domain-containing protein n=1 Tax=Rhabditophanes sp. KR3021 TaxID=114890 RepID=A0AC35U7Y9_9BILA